MPSTSFTPRNHGFKFDNRFSNHRFAFGGIHLNFGGRCGGMIYTALDHFRTRMRVPGTTSLPPEGSTLSTYISVRQDVSTWSNVDRWMELVLGQPARSAEFYRWGLQERGGQAGRLKASIDNNRPVPLNLVSAVDLFSDHHQVLAIGYDGSGESLRIRVYDPNYPDVVKTLRPFPDSQLWGYDSGNSEDAHWRTYFVDMNYRTRDPHVLLRDPSNDFAGRSYRGQNLHKQKFLGDILTGADFIGATATYTDFGMANLQYAKFEGANVSHTNFSEANLDRANFKGADLKNSTLARIFAPNANFHGADLKLVNEKVDRRDMGTINLEKADFYGADLHRANFTKAHAVGANFHGANLSHSNFESANLSEANLEGADLRHACLKKANLTDANLKGADLRGADTTRAIGLPERI